MNITASGYADEIVVYDDDDDGDDGGGGDDNDNNDRIELFIFIEYQNKNKCRILFKKLCERLNSMWDTDRLDLITYNSETSEVLNVKYDSRNSMISEMYHKSSTDSVCD